MILLNENFCYVVEDEVAIEDFQDGSLLFLCRQRKIVEINPTARDVISLLDRKRYLGQIINKIAHDHKLEKSEIEKDVHVLISNLGQYGAIRPLVKKAHVRRKKMEKPLFLLANPDVSLRKEEEGALLFNADTNSLQIINSTGLHIWQFIQVHPRTVTDIIKYLIQTCDGVPSENVESDIEKFIADLKGKGFIGEVIDGNKH